MSDRNLLHGLILVLIVWALFGTLGDRKGAASLGLMLTILVLIA